MGDLLAARAVLLSVTAKKIYVLERHRDGVRTGVWAHSTLTGLCDNAALSDVWKTYERSEYDSTSNRVGWRIRWRDDFEMTEIYVDVAEKSERMKMKIVTEAELAASFARAADGARSGPHSPGAFAATKLEEQQ